MQFDDTNAACRMMQAIDVLRYQGVNLAVRLEICKGTVGGIRPRPAEAPPADVATRPVTLSRSRLLDEVGVLDGLRGLPLAMAITVIGNAGRRAHARATQHDY